MALALTDLESYRHRRETKREQDLRLEVTALAADVKQLVEDVEPSMRRLWIVAREMGPVAMHDWSAVARIHARLMALSGPDAAA